MTPRTLAFLLVLATGCYTELAVGPAIVDGPHIDRELGATVTLWFGGEFSAPEKSGLVGFSWEQGAGTNTRPTALGLTLGGDLQVAGDREDQLRLLARITPAALSWVETADGSEFGYSVPLYFGAAWVWNCDDFNRCFKLGAGIEADVFHRARYGVG